MTLAENNISTMRQGAEMNSRAVLAKQYLMREYELSLHNKGDRRKRLLGRMLQNASWNVKKGLKNVKHSLFKGEINTLLNSDNKNFNEYVQSRLGGDSLLKMSTQEFKTFDDDLMHFRTPPNTPNAVNDRQYVKDTLEQAYKTNQKHREKVLRSLRMLDSISKETYDHNAQPGVFLQEFMDHIFQHTALGTGTTAFGIRTSLPGLSRDQLDQIYSMRDLVQAFDIPENEILRSYQRFKYSHIARNLTTVIGHVQATKKDAKLYKDSEGIMYLIDEATNKGVIINHDAKGEIYYTNASGGNKDMNGAMSANMINAMFDNANAIDINPSTTVTTQLKKIDIATPVNAMDPSTYSYLYRDILKEKTNLLSTESKLRVLDTMSEDKETRNVEDDNNGYWEAKVRPFNWGPRGWLQNIRRVSKVLHKYGIGATVGMISKGTQFPFGGPHFFVGTLGLGISAGGLYHWLDAEIKSRDPEHFVSELAGFMIRENKSRVPAHTTRAGSRAGLTDEQVKKLALLQGKDADAAMLSRVLGELTMKDIDMLHQVVQLASALLKILQQRKEGKELWTAQILTLQEAARRRIMELDTDNFLQSLTIAESTRSNAGLAGLSGFKSTSSAPTKLADEVLERNIRAEMEDKNQQYENASHTHTPEALRERFRSNVRRSNLLDANQLLRNMGMVTSTAVAGRLFSEAIHAVTDFTGFTTGVSDFTLNTVRGTTGTLMGIGEKLFGIGYYWFEKFFHHGLGEIVGDIMHATSLDHVGDLIGSSAMSTLHSARQILSYVTISGEKHPATNMVILGAWLAALHQGYKRGAHKIPAKLAKKLPGLSQTLMKHGINALKSSYAKKAFKYGSLVATGPAAFIVQQTAKLPKALKAQLHDIDPSYVSPLQQQVAADIHETAQQGYAATFNEITSSLARIANAKPLFTNEIKDSIIALNEQFTTLYRGLDGQFKKDTDVLRVMLRELTHNIQNFSGSEARAKTDIQDIIKLMTTIKQRHPKLRTS